MEERASTIRFDRGNRDGKDRLFHQVGEDQLRRRGQLRAVEHFQRHRSQRQRLAAEIALPALEPQRSAIRGAPHAIAGIRLPNVAFRLHQFQMEARGHPRQQSDAEGGDAARIVARRFGEACRRDAGVVRIPDVQLSASESLLGDRLKGEHVPRLKDYPGGKRIPVEHSRRGFEGPHFRSRGQKEPPREAVRLPGGLTGCRIRRVKLELQLARIGRVRQFAIHGVCVGSAPGIPDVIPIPGSSPNVQAP